MDVDSTKAFVRRSLAGLMSVVLAFVLLVKARPVYATTEDEPSANTGLVCQTDGEDFDDEGDDEGEPDDYDEDDDEDEGDDWSDDDEGDDSDEDEDWDGEDDEDWSDEDEDWDDEDDGWDDDDEDWDEEDDWDDEDDEDWEDEDDWDDEDDEDWDWSVDGGGYDDLVDPAGYFAYSSVATSTDYIVVAKTISRAAIASNVTNPGVAHEQPATPIVAVDVAEAPASPTRTLAKTGDKTNWLVPLTLLFLSGTCVLVAKRARL